MAGEMFGGVIHHLAIRKAFAQHVGIGGVDLHRDDAAVPIHALNEQLGEGTSAGPELHHKFVGTERAILHDGAREDTRTGPHAARDPGLAKKFTKEVQTRPDPRVNTGPRGALADLRHVNGHRATSDRPGFGGNRHGARLAGMRADATLSTMEGLGEIVAGDLHHLLLEYGASDQLVQLLLEGRAIHGEFDGLT